jgi:hypothetical protein
LQPDVIVAASSIVASTLLPKPTIPVVFVTASIYRGWFRCQLGAAEQRHRIHRQSFIVLRQWLELFRCSRRYFTAVCNPTAPAGGTYFHP